MGVFVLGLLFCTIIARAQSPTAVVNGQVRDISGAAIPKATVIVINDATNIRYTTETNDQGIYSVPNLPPGTYRIQVSKQGFKTIVHPDIVLHIQDAEAIGFTLSIGPTSDTVTVEGGAPIINTTDGSVGTVVDRKYVENIPLNGRSFQNLILLTPGVVSNNPQSRAGGGNNGEFSVNGQRTESNYYVVDGVSANVGIALDSPQRASFGGGLPASTALGTTQGLVSVDALQEFRVQSSTYSAEFGRNPGGQFSFVTRSGTNQWHGTVFEYLRNNVFDSNDWFNNYFTKQKPALRQNDFGGTFGGPIRENRTFFLFSYEGLRALQPQAATPQLVPDANLRATTPAPLQQVMNAFPLPSPGAPNFGNGFGQFIGTWSNPGDIDSTSIRLDHTINDKLRLFFRFNDTTSSLGLQDQLVASIFTVTGFTTRTYTFGATSSFSSRLNNEFRLNYSSNAGKFTSNIGNFAGAKAIDLAQIQGLTSGSKSAPFTDVVLSFGTQFTILQQYGFSGRQSTWNLTDTVGLSLGSHQLKLGIDFRRLTPDLFVASPSLDYEFFSASSVQSNSVDFGSATSTAPAHPVYSNFSAFAQDEWRLSRRLNLSMGLRWEVNPAPGGAKANLPYTVQGSSLSTLTLAPQGTPLWKTTWFNFAPRLGLAYVLRDKTAWETVIRGGVGVFFDTGQQLGSFGYSGPGFSSHVSFGGLIGSSTSFPIPAAQANPAIINPPVLPFKSCCVFFFSPHLQLPYTLQWNASIEQALGKSQALTISYVGANGRRLLRLTQISLSSINPNFGLSVLTDNGLTSDHNAMQVQYQRRLARGLQALASYTWAHTIDFGSRNTSFPYVRGNSDYDIRHNFSAALSYDLPNASRSAFARALLNHWGLDNRFTARTGFPVTLDGRTLTDPVTHQQFHAGLNLVPGQPLYVSGAQCTSLYNTMNISSPMRTCPGGRAINPSAFALPPSGQFGNAPRNFVRGFGAWQMDLAVRREFPVFERLKLQFRAEAFNIFNHPNFGRVNAAFCDPTKVFGCTFGQATSTLANSLGGLNPLYQMGGPRSMQLALRLAF